MFVSNMRKYDRGQVGSGWRKVVETLSRISWRSTVIFYDFLLFACVFATFRRIHLVYALHK